MWKAGFGKVDVTPPLGAAYLSFQPRQTPFKGVHDPLFSRAVALEGANERVIMISVDSLGFSADVLGTDWDFIAATTTRIAAATGVSPDHVLLAATHAHSTPQTTHIAPSSQIPELEQWIRDLPDRIALSAVRAIEDLKDAALFYGRGEVKDVARNRRADLYSGNAPLDPELSALVIRRCEDYGIVLNYACHPVTVQAQPLVSADFPGRVGEILETQHEVNICLFLQGAAGDINPVRDTTDFSDVDRYGSAIAKVASHILSGPLNQDKPLDEFIACAVDDVILDHRPPPPEDTIWETGAIPAKEAALRLNELARVRQITCRIQVIRLGDVLILAVAGELFTEWGLALKRAFPNFHVMVAGYANGYIGYIPPTFAFDRGGYETAPGPWSRILPDGGSRIVKKLKALGHWATEGGLRKRD